ncbi:RDD family protein [Desulfosporosinus nitroreducens]|uniref:RDD family protein n=1 Tax=Desulfosporosinus nitroreducens TaxID=2018668 RepID=A0ABT8QRA9_9FIRM|nr:RDD family protein [Desulfosporosinus nitroreducens]MCO1603097.1 RDD family protein [Desulfosporosinus nitroreducens]MDO0823867.1 RDD family protein [Desulfosporosinus nitroreducens]
MTQSEYLRELKENLAGRLAPEMVMDILTDYESFFVSGREDGKTDDEISEGLGSPAYLAKALLQEQAQTETGQTEKPDKHIANPGRRLCAFLIDAVIAVLPAFIVTSFLGSAVLTFFLLMMYPSPLGGAFVYTGYATFQSFSVVESSPGSSITIPEGSQENVRENVRESVLRPTTLSIAAALLALAFYLLYSVAATLIFKGQTVGKKLMRLKVRRSDSGPLTKGGIFSRELLGKVLINSIPIVPLISIVTILLTKEHKALHDLLADTIVANV